MNYQFPDTLSTLRARLAAAGIDVSSLKTERQATFMAQQILGTRFKFPPKGSSCYPLLQRMQESLPALQTNGCATARNPTVRSDRTVEPAAPKAKRGKARRPVGARTPATSATGFETGVVIYCDGGCEPNPGPGGWGFVVYRDGVEVHAESGGSLTATNNTMELTAALMALRWIAENALKPQTVRLLCDSQYTVRGCNEWRHGWKRQGWKRGVRKELANAELWRDLDEMLTRVPLTLEWVKGHAGTLGNERADELAEIGRQ